MAKKKTTKFSDPDIQRAEQRCLEATQQFHDELCRASQRRASLEGVEIGNFATRRGFTPQEQERNLLVVVGFGPVVYHGLQNALTAKAPDGTWTAWLRCVGPKGRFTRDKNLYPWYSAGAPMLYQLYPGYREVQPVHLKVGLAFRELP